MSAQITGMMFMVNQMLSDVPNSDAMIRRFQNIEEHLERCSCNSNESRVSHLEQNQTNLAAFQHLLNKPDECHVVAITNELYKKKEGKELCYSQPA